MDWIVISVVSIGLYGLALAGLAYLLLALKHVLCFHKETPRHDGVISPAVTVMKPLCGDEPGLYDCLRSFFLQDYPAYQLVFGVRDAGDAAVAVVNRLRAEFPNQDVAVVIDARIYGANLKVSNLINMMPSCRHDMLVVADSDVAVGSDALTSVVAQISSEGVGAVSCLYQGRPLAGPVSRLGALYINDWFLPSVLVDVSLSGVDGCFGALMAFRREALASVGGFHAVADHLAEDNLLGRLIRLRGWQVRISSYTVDTMVSENRLSSLVDHEVRWSRTVRSCRPRDHILSVTTFPLPLLLIFLAVEPSILGCFLVALHVGLRLALHFAVRVRFSRGVAGRAWMADAALVPLREVLCAMVWVMSLLGQNVRWRNREYRITRDGHLVMNNARDLPLSSPPPVSAPVGE
ncbi:MAG TPA: bacteriohopanetetrol glucosamine biosynthesis glycosyltransferase HpnI [Telmatospirillum sp.]|nr:bacteriohopanetetrol glucosamine biosynthesis glycosyltransferase HpnI [Telmatospirillum sp.]